MYHIIEYENIDKNNIDGNYCLIDVRSPGEYRLYTIPDSINIPIFDDEERKMVGTAYVQEGAEVAKKLGIQIVSKKLPDMYDKIYNLSRKYKNLIFFCARGGLRSGSLVALLVSLGINAMKLNGGYKRYRKYIIKALPESVKGVQFIVLYGNTGVGKTEVLKALREEGMDILDLEACANHRGSFFGSVGLREQNSQKMFESLLYKSLKSRKSNIVFVEGESRKIGKIVIPDYIFNAILEGIHINISASLETRINNIYRDYVRNNDSEIISALELLRKHLGDRNIEYYKELIYQSQHRKVIEELMVKYYDPLYGYKRKDYTEVFINENPAKTARDIIQWVKGLKNRMAI
ncbi:MAG TPA: tRNA 2-selenouridine(34) synthase MnmH [Tissierellia bacterium]|nr:tRNA 2-selenouridine(34) synthase MnmH [Tissierellia bacterium]